MNNLKRLAISQKKFERKSGNLCGTAYLTKEDKPTARTTKFQQTAAPVSGKKTPQSRCALSRCAI
jgi:hypothetical protein